jgi:drug/metabolite transporter (DMT)-like permease
VNPLLSIAFVGAWSSGFIGAGLGAGSAPAVTLLLWRFLPLAAVLGLASLTVTRRAWRGATRGELARQVLVGALSQSGYLLTVYYAIQLGVSTGTTALIDGTQPLVAGALAGPLLGTRVSRTQWAGLALGVTGVAVVTSADAGAAEGVPGWAYLVPFLGMLCLVAATILDRRSPSQVPPSVAMTVHVGTSAVVFGALAAATGTAAPPSATSFWVAVAWLVVLPTFGGYGLYWLLLRRSGVTRVNTLMFLMAPVTAVWGALMFGEPFGVQTGAGLALGLTAVAVVHRGERRRPQPHAQGGSGSGDERGAQADHRRGDETVKDAPRRGPGQEAAQQTGAEAQRGEPAQAREDGTESEGPPQRAPVGGHGPEEEDRVQVDVRVEPGHRQTGQHRPPPRPGRLPLHPQGGRPEHPTGGQHAVDDQEGPADHAHRGQHLGPGHDRRAHPADAERDQRGVGHGTDAHHREDRVAADALAQHEGVLGADRDDE